MRSKIGRVFLLDAFDGSLNIHIKNGIGQDRRPVGGDRTPDLRRIAEHRAAEAGRVAAGAVYRGGEIGFHRFTGLCGQRFFKARKRFTADVVPACLLYTSDAADE